MKKIVINKRLITLLGATTIALTMSGCEKGNENKKTEPTSIVITSSPEETNIVLASPSPIKTPEVTDIEASHTTDIEITPRPTETPTQKEEKTPIKTSTPSSTKTPVKTPSKTPTKTSTPTKTPSPTQAPVTIEPLTKSNINDISKIEALATLYYGNIYSGGPGSLLMLNYTYNDEDYICGKEEFKYMIAVINEKNMSKDTLIELLGDKTLEDFDRYSNIWRCLHKVLYQANGELMYDNFIADKNVSNYLKELEEKTKYRAEYNNDEEYYQYIKKFYEGTNPYINFNDNVVVDYFTCLALQRASAESPHWDLFMLAIDHDADTAQLYEYVTSENGLYAKTRSNQLTR